MSKIDGYGVYQNFYEKNLQSRSGVKKNEKLDKTSNVKKTEKTEPAELSERAKKLLEELKKKYGNMDFMVADYESEEEAAEYLSRGNKEFSVLIEPELLEEMAADESTKEKYLSILDDAASKLTNIKEQMTEEEQKEVKHIGVSVGKDGVLTFFADLEKASEKQRQRIENAKEEKKAEREEAAAKKKDKVKKTRVTADSAEELLDKIRNIDWEQVREEMAKTKGSKVDFTV